MSPTKPESTPEPRDSPLAFSAISGQPGRRPIPRWIFAVAAILLVLLVIRLRSSGTSAAAKSGKQAPARAVPVVTVSASRGDLGVYLTGLGSVTALNTVTVRSRVDGQLLRVRFREGEVVHQGDLLAEIDPRPFEVQLTQAEGQKAKDEAALENARADQRRYEVLSAQEIIPRQQLDTQIATVRQGEASVKSDQGPVDSAKLNLAYSRITAPITGRVGLKLVDPGNIVHAADAGGLVVLTQLQPIAVVFTIPADALPPVLARMKGGRRLEVDVFDRDLKTKLATGELSAVDNQIDSSTGTVKLKATFANRDNALFANQFVNARLLVDTLKGAVLVSAAAIQRSPQATFVWFVKPDSSVEMRTVEVLHSEGDRSAIKGNVSPGDRLVVEGVDKLQPGTKVTVGEAGPRDNSQAADADRRRQTTR